MRDQNRYLVVLDDDPLIGEIIAKSLELSVKSFASAEHLLQELGALDPLGVFIDIELEGSMNGLDVLKDLRDRWPYVPIIVISSHQDFGSLAKALAQGANDFIKKPLHPDELRARFQLRLEDALDKSKQDLLHYGDITLQVPFRVLEGPKARRYASPIEVAILICLMGLSGQFIDKTSLKAKAWGQTKVTDNALHRKLHALRQILKDVSDQVSIETRYGVGVGLRSQTMINKAPKAS